MSKYSTFRKCKKHLFLYLFLLIIPFGNLKANQPEPKNETEKLLHQATIAISQNQKEALIFSKKAIQLAEQNQQYELKADAQSLICSMYMSGMNYDSLYQYCNAASSIFENQRDHQAGENNIEKIAWVYQRKGIIEDMLGDRTKSQETLKKSLAMFQSLNNEKGIGYVLNDLAVTYSFDGNYVEASQHFIDALQLFEKNNDELGRVRSLTSLGFLFKLLMQDKKAEDYFNQAITIAEKTGDQYWTAMSLMGLVKMARKKEDHTTAIQLNDRLVNIGEKLGSYYFLLDAYRNQAFISFDLGKMEEAKIAVEKALQINNQQNRKQSESVLLNLMAKIYLQEDKLAKALPK